MLLYFSSAQMVQGGKGAADLARPKRAYHNGFRRIT